MCIRDRLYTAENIQEEEFNPADFHLGDELLGAVDETWQSLKDTFSLSVLANPIEASKGDGEMATGAMGVMGEKFGSAAAAYSYLIFVLLYVPCISVMGAIARESSRGWMGFSVLWGLNIAYSLSTLFYQAVSYKEHPTYSLVCILAVILFNIVLLGLLRRARSRVDLALLATNRTADVYQRQVTKKVTWAASLGDRSEHADYQYNKKRLREIDRRVRYLTKCMENLKIVDYSPQQEGKVFFGAWVEIENDDGDIRKFRIVGYDEIFGRKDYISIDSPMARALLKKEVGDLAVVNTPGGEASWYVNEIEYVK